MTRSTSLATVAALRAFLANTGPFEIAVWDFDGVVGDTEPTQAKVYREMLTEQGIVVEDDFFRDLAGRSESEIWAMLRTRCGVEGEVAALREERIARVAPVLVENVIPSWFVRPGIRGLREMNTRSVVISSGNAAVIDHYLERWNLRSLFDRIWAISDRPGVPSKRERLRDTLAGAASALVIEDSAEYLRLAAELGAVTLGVRHTLNGNEAEVATAILRGGTECLE